MAIYNLGSINIDHFYRLPHLPGPGETLASPTHSASLGGKGANQSVAAARAGAQVFHIGAIGAEGASMRARMQALGVDCSHVSELSGATGHAIILRYEKGENSIVIHPGVNRMIPGDAAIVALAQAGKGDVLILQNETSAQLEAARFARQQGLYVVYSAAPFEVEAVKDVLPFVDLLLLNTVEAEQFERALGHHVTASGVPNVVITRGGDGAEWHDCARSEMVFLPAFTTEVTDTTGAGDTFAGYLVAGLAEGRAPVDAMRLAAAAGAVKVQRAGTAEAIPARAEVEAFLKDQPSE